MKKYTPPVIKTFSHKKLEQDYIKYATEHLNRNHAKLPAAIVNETKNIKTLEDNVSNISKITKHISIGNNIDKELTSLRKKINILKADNKIKSAAALVKSNAEFDKKLQKYKDSFSETFSDTSMKFSEHCGMFNEKYLNSLLRQKDYDYLIEMLWGENDDFNYFNYVATTATVKSNTTKLKPYVLFDDSSHKYDGFAIDNFIIGREFSLKDKIAIDRGKQSYYDSYSFQTGHLADGLFLSDTIHIVQKGKFCPVDTSKLSSQDKTDYTKALVLVARVYDHISSLGKKEGENFQPIEKYPGITADHEVFSNYSLLS